MAVRVLIAAGGTVGHVAPALVVADELRGRGVEVVFAGTPNRVEAQLVPARGYRLETFRVAGLERRVSARLVGAIAADVAAPLACARILRRVRPDVVYGAGGYVAGPMLAAAASWRLPTVLSEWDAQLGLANRLAAPLARRVLLTYPVAGRDGDRYRVVGRPVEPAFFTTDRAAARAAYGLDENEFTMSIFGGSLGALPVNRAVADGWPEGPPPGTTLLHVVGTGRSGGVTPSERHRVFEYCSTMPAFLAAADIVVCRAGGSVWEVAATARPAILVPWAGAAADHQTANAAFFAAAGAAEVIADADLDGALLRRVVDALAADVPRRRRMAEAMRGLARPDAARTIADEILALATGGPPAVGAAAAGA